MHDVAIIGGGPAGSSAATLLAQRGRSVVVFEREKFPRFHIGESLLPFSMAALERLGVMKKVEAAGFMPKHGAGVSTGTGEREVQFYFKNGFRPERETAFQVERSRFDELLLDHAEEAGAAVWQETTVSGVEFSDEGVTLRVRGTDGVEREEAARYLLDCSGRNAVVGQQFDLKRTYPKLKKFAIYAHYEGVKMPDGVDGTLTRMVRTEAAWFWLIPLTRERVSVGVVMDTERFRAAGLSAEAMLEREIATTEAVRERMRDARLVSKVYAGGDYSYRSERLNGDRWLLAGDAAGFIDPIFSSGVFLALLGGERAADALEAALSDETCGRAGVRRLLEGTAIGDEAVSGICERVVSAGVRGDAVESDGVFRRRASGERGVGGESGTGFRDPVEAVGFSRGGGSAAVRAVVAPGGFRMSAAVRFFAVAAVVVLGLTGCATVTLPEFTPTESRRAAVTVKGEVGTLEARGVFERDQAENVRITIESNEEEMLTLARITGGWAAVGPLAKGDWQGHPDNAPAHLAGWVALGEAFEAATHMDGRKSEYRSGRLSVIFTFEEVHLSTMEVRAVATGEQYRVRF